MACKVCNSFTYDCTIPGSPESLEAIFEYEITSNYPLCGMGIGKCNHCGQEIEFSFENFSHEKISVRKVEQVEN